MKLLIGLCLLVLVGCQSKSESEQTTMTSQVVSTQTQVETTVQTSETSKKVEGRMNLTQLVSGNYASVVGMWGDSEVTHLVTNPVNTAEYELVYDHFIVNETGGVKWEGNSGTDVFHILPGYSKIEKDTIITSVGRPDGARDVHSVIFIPAGVVSSDLAINGDVTKDRIVVNFSYDIGVFSRIFYRVN